MAVTFRAATEDARGTAGLPAPAPPAGTSAGDLLVAVQTCDVNGSLAGMTAPAGWSEVGSSSQAATGFMKVWTKVATSSEPIQYDFVDETDSQGSVVVVAVTGQDTTTPLSVLPQFTPSGTASTSHPAPSAGGVSGGLLLTAHLAASGGTVRSYTAPSGMTVAKTSQLSTSPNILTGVYTEQLTTATATGTRTAVCSASTTYLTMSLVVAPVGASQPPPSGGASFRSASEDSRGTANPPVPAPPAGTQVGDLLLAFHCSDTRGSLAEMAAPTGWSEVASNSARAADVGFIKIWSKNAVAADVSATSFTFVDSTAATADVIIVAVAGAGLTVGVPSWNSGAAATTHPALSVTGVAGGVLLTLHVAGTNGTSRSYTAPSGMTEAEHSQITTGGFILEQVNYLDLAAAGATSNRIATCSAAAPFVTAALVVAPPAAQTVVAAGFASAAAFGDPTVTVAAAPQTVTITAGIPSTQAFGSPVVNVPSPSGSGALYPGTGTFPDTATFPGMGSDQTVVVVRIDSAEDFGVPVVAGGQTVTPAGIGGAETFGVPSLSGQLTVSGPYPGATTFPGGNTYPSQLVTEPLYPDDPLYPEDNLFPGALPPVVSAQTVTPAGIASGEVFGSSAVNVSSGPQTVTVTALDSAAVFGVPSVGEAATDIVIDAAGSGIASAEGFGRPFIFLEVPPPVVTPGFADTYYIDGVDLSNFAWRIETAEGLQITPGVVGDDVVLPGLDGAVEIFGGLGQQRRPDAIGRIVFNLSLIGVDPVTGLIPGGSNTAEQYFTQWDSLVRLFHRRRVTIDHPRPDGSVRRAAGHLLPGESIAPSRTPGSAWFGRFKATFAIPSAHWTDTATVTTGQHSLLSGDDFSLAAFDGATAPCTELTVVFGAGNNPRLSTSWGHIGWNGVISSGRQLGIDTVTGTTNQAGGSAWTPGYDSLTFAPGPRLFEIDPSESLTAILTHTGGGSMTVEVSGKRRYRTS